jgi:hypothetical protein
MLRLNFPKDRLREMAACALAAARDAASHIQRTSLPGTMQEWRCSDLTAPRDYVIHTIRDDMFSSTYAAMTEASLLSLEASRVVALRMQVMMLGGTAAWNEADLMVREKTKAFGQAFIDLSTGSSQASVCSDLRAVVKDNYERLSARGRLDW